MRINNPAFELINNSASKSPRFVVEIRFASADLVYLTSHADALIPNGATAIHGVIKNISSTTQAIDPRRANATIGSISFDVIDLNGSVTDLFRAKLIDGKGLRRKRCRFYMGFDGLESFSEYSLLQTQLVERADHDGGEYRIQCMDVQRQLREEIFNLKKTALSASISDDDTVIPSYRTIGFETVAHGAGYSDAPNQKVGYLKIGTGEEYEIVRYTGKTSNSFTGVTRGALGTRAREWEFKGDTESNGLEITEYVYLEMPAVKLAYAVLTGILFQQPGETLPEHWHLGVATEFVRLSDFAQIGSDWYEPSNDTLGQIVYFQGLDKQDGKKFIEEEIYLLLGAFSPVHSDGSLGLKRMTGVLSGAGYVSVLNEDNITSYGALRHDMREVSNRLLINWSWNETRQDYTRRNLLVDSESIARHEESELLTLNFRGLSGNRHTYATIRRQFDGFRDRYAGPPLKLSLSVMPGANVFEVGDIVRVNMTQLRDFSGTAQLDRAFEIQRVKVDWIRGGVELELFGSSQAAAPLPDQEEGTYLPNDWYTSAGTNIRTAFPGQTTESGGIVTIVAPIDLSGGENLNAAPAIYYVNGSLTIASGVTVTYNKNTQLRVAGFFQNNGTLNGKGRGHAGGLGSTSTATNAPQTLGTPGYLGPTIFSQMGPRSISGNSNSIQAESRVAGVRALYDSMPSLGLSVEGGALFGLPDDLRGSSGPGGSPAVSGNTTRVFEAAGGNGGNGGAGLAIVCRGMGIGAGGKIICSGNDGGAAGAWTRSDGLVLYGGGGAGGGPGGVVIALDGITATPPDLINRIDAFVGNTNVQGDAVAPVTIDSVASYPTGISVRLGQAAWGFESAINRPDVSGHDMSFPQTAVRTYWLIGEFAVSPDLPDTSDSPLTITLEELPNTPRTPAGNLSTVVVTVAPPSDSQYSFSEIDYQQVGDNGWFDGGPASPQALVVLPSDGRTYRFRARAVSRQGIASPSGPTATITLRNITTAPNDSDIKDVLSVPNIRGLELFEQGNNTDFEGRDAKLTWRRSSVFEWYGLGYEPPAEGAGAGALDLYFKDFEVRIFNADDDALRRTEFVIENEFVYTWEKNLEDSKRLGAASPRRQFRVEVRQRSRQNQVSSQPAKLTVQNPAPAIPSITLSPAYTFITMYYDLPSDPDWAGIQVWMAETAGFTPSDDNLKFIGPDTTINLAGLEPGQAYFLRYQPYDAFGPGDMSPEIETGTQRLNQRDLDQDPPTVPTGLVITTGVEDSKLYTRSWVKLEWDASVDPNDGLVANYFLQYWDSVDPTKIESSSAIREFRITVAIPGRTYYMRVAAMDWAGNLSAYSDTVSIEAAGDTEAPSVPTGLIATAGLDKVILSWVNPPEDDVVAVVIYRSTTAGFTPGPSNLLATFPATPSGALEFVDADVITNQTYRYRLSAVDVSGNESTVSGEASATPFRITSANIDDYFTNGALTGQKLADLAVDAQKLASSAVTAEKIANLAVGNAAIANGAITTAKIGTGQITNALIEDATIQNAKISTLDAAKINTGILNADRIGANSITATKLNVTSLSAITADLGIVTAGTILGNSIFTSLTAPYVGFNTSGIIGVNASNFPTFVLDITGSGQLGLTNPIQWDASGVVTVPGTLISGEIIGKTIKTAASGWRVEMDGLGVKYWDGANTRFKLDDLGNATFSGDISGSTITGGTVRTSSGNTRIELLGSNNSMLFRREESGTSKVALTISTTSATFGDLTKNFFLVVGDDAITDAGIGTKGIEYGILAFGGVYGVLGSAPNGIGVQGFSNLTGVRGTAFGTNGTGVWAVSDGGGASVGVAAGGEDLAWAFYGFDGNAKLANGTWQTFTGAHEGLLDKEASVIPGDIIVDVSIVGNPGLIDVVFLNEISIYACQHSIGVFVKRSNLPEISEGDQNIVPTPLKNLSQSDYEDIRNKYDLIEIAAIGEGMINVCSEGGNIADGDLIVTSSTPGKGMKQADDIVRSYTVAKARLGRGVVLDWSLEGVTTKQIPCIYLCG
jgi:hypothetical protein